MTAYSKGDLGDGVYLGGQKVEVSGNMEEVGSGEVVSYKEDKMYVTHTHTHTYTHTHTHTHHGVSVAFSAPRDGGCVRGV